jgi:hypothetical protein
MQQDACRCNLLVGGKKGKPAVIMAENTQWIAKSREQTGNAKASEIPHYVLITYLIHYVLATYLIH